MKVRREIKSVHRKTKKLCSVMRLSFTRCRLARCVKSIEAHTKPAATKNQREKTVMKPNSKRMGNKAILFYSKLIAKRRKMNPVSG